MKLERRQDSTHTVTLHRSHTQHIESHNTQKPHTHIHTTYRNHTQNTEATHNTQKTHTTHRRHTQHTESMLIAGDSTRIKLSFGSKKGSKIRHIKKL